MGILCLIYLVCALRTNVVFVLIFITLIMTFSFITGAYWALAADYTGNAGFAAKLQVVSLTPPPWSQTTVRNRISILAEADGFFLRDRPPALVHS